MESDAQIFTIGLHKNPCSAEELQGPQLLENLAHASGGISYMVSDVNRWQAVMGQIGVTLHNQYVGYYPPPDAAIGKYRKIKVQLLLPPGLPPLRIFARTATMRRRISLNGRPRISSKRVHTSDETILGGRVTCGRNR